MLNNEEKNILIRYVNIPKYLLIATGGVLLVWIYFWFYLFTGDVNSKVANTHIMTFIFVLIIISIWLVLAYFYRLLYWKSRKIILKHRKLSIGKRVYTFFVFSTPIRTLAKAMLIEEKKSQGVESQHSTFFPLNKQRQHPALFFLFVKKISQYCAL